MKTLKVLGYLLTYPQKEIVAAWPEMCAVLKEEQWLSEKTVKALENIGAWMTMTSLLDVQEEYVSLFDRTPSLSLHLFEHIHGDSRERGQAMVDLSDIYKNKGFLIVGDEMPDYLPMFLEYLSNQTTEEARSDLGDVIDVLATLGGRLEKRQSRYTAVFKALEEAANKKPNEKAVAKALELASGLASTEEELDSAWEEQFAFEKQPNEQGSCPKVGSMVAQLNKEIQLEKVKEA